MGVKILRISSVLLILVSAFLLIGLALNLSGTTQIVRCEEIYARGTENFTIVADTDAVSVFGDYSEFYKITYEELDRSRTIIAVGTAFSANESSHLYNLTLPLGGECQIYTKYDSAFIDLVYLDEILAGNPYSDISTHYLSFYDHTTNKTSLVAGATSARSEDGLVITEPILMHFGTTYTPYDYGTVITDPSLAKNDEVHFEVFDANGKRTDSILSVDGSGNISVLGTDEGYFKVYTERNGGVMVPFTVSYEDSPIIQLVIDSYERMTGVKLEAKDVTSEIIASLTELETDTIPSFLTESMFANMFPNIETLRINLKSDVSGDMCFYLPNTLKHVEILNGDTNRLEINASFYGNGSNTKMTLAGALTLNGNGKDPTFFGFEAFTLEIGRENFFGSDVEIFSQNASSSASPDALNVFSEIGKLHIIANHADLTVKAGAGAVVNYGLKSGKGGSAIVCDELIIENSKTVRISGGRGGVGFVGKDGKDGYFEINGMTVTSHFYHGTGGGNGGDGGDAVNVKRMKYTGSGTLELIGGNGGKGGKGGNGGNGAKDDDLPWYLYLIYGDGRSGDGGNGGNGGDGGYALLISESLESYSTINITASSGGAAGGRGSAGQSADRGKDGDSDGMAGEGYSYLVMSGVIIGNEPTT